MFSFRISVDVPLPSKSDICYKNRSIKFRLEYIVYIFYFLCILYSIIAFNKLLLLLLLLLYCNCNSVIGVDSHIAFKPAIFDRRKFAIMICA